MVILTFVLWNLKKLKIRDKTSQVLPLKNSFWLIVAAWTVVSWHNYFSMKKFRLV